MSVYAPSGSGNVHIDRVRSGGGKVTAAKQAGKKPKAPVKKVPKGAAKPATKPATRAGAPMVPKGAAKPATKKVAAKRTGRRGGK